MILPGTYTAALLLLVVSMICWGSWANTFKLTKGWRFELFYFDFAAGVLLTAVIAAYTLGSMGEELTFSDNLLTAGKRQMFFALVAGALFNLSNLLLVAAISVVGMAVAFPIVFGFAFLLGVILNYFMNPQGNPLLLFAGGTLAALAAVAAALA